MWVVRVDREREDGKVMRRERSSPPPPFLRSDLWLLHPFSLLLSCAGRRGWEMLFLAAFPPAEAIAIAYIMAGTRIHACTMCYVCEGREEVVVGGEA